MHHDTIKINKASVRMVAHRGASGLELENTAAAFVAAGNRSYWGIETDVHRTADGRFVVIHDDDTRRVALCDLPVEGTDFELLRSLAMKDKDGCIRRDLCIPTLQEYIRICKKYEKTAVLELKNAFDEDDIRKIVYIISEEGWLDEVIFISFNFDNMLHLRKMLPNQRCQILTSGAVTDELIASLKANNLDLDIRYTSLTEENIAQLHEQGIKVNCWTVDNPEDAAKLIDWGIDFITSNRLE